MFGIGQPELLVILFIVLLFFGPSSLPKLSKTIGKSAGALSDGFTNGENDKSLKDITEEITSSAIEIKESIIGVKQTPQTPSLTQTPGYGENDYGQKENV